MNSRSISCILLLAILAVQCTKRDPEKPSGTDGPVQGVYVLPLIETTDMHGHIVSTDGNGNVHYQLAYIADKADDIRGHGAQRSTLIVPEIPSGSFAKKLYSTFLSYLPESKVAFSLKTNSDARGSFTELVKTLSCGQFSLNISEPGATKGQHWHNTKWEFFIVVCGRALIQERRIGSDEVLNFEVSGKEIKAVHMLPGYTHNIINLSDTEPLVTLMWANELFDPHRPDTYSEPVE